MSKKKLGVVLVAGVAVIVALSGILGTDTRKDENLIGAEDGQVVQVAKASVEDIQSELSATGMIVTADSEVVFSETNSIVHKIHKDVGDEVKAGDVIITLDPQMKERLERELAQLDIQISNAKIALDQLNDTGSKAEILQAESALLTANKAEEDLETNIASIRANLEIAQTDLKSTEDMYQLAKELFDAGLGSQKDLEDAEKAYRLAAENVTQIENNIISLEKEIENIKLQQELAQHTLDVLQNNVSDKTKTDAIQMRQNEIAALQLQRETLVQEIEKAEISIVAPIDGVISEMQVLEGSPITQGMPVATIIDDTKLIVQSEISTFYAPQIVEGLEGSIRYNGVEVIEVPAKITMVAPSAKQGVSATGAATSTIPVELELEGDVSKLKPGLLVDVKITTQKEEGVVAVPLLATMADDDKEEYVLVVNEDYTIEQRYVTKGVADNYMIQVSDIEEGEVIITNPTRALENGMQVRYRDFE